MLFKYYFCYNLLLLSAKATIIIFIFHFIDFEYSDCQGGFCFSAFAIFFYFIFFIRVIIAIVFLYSIYFGSESILLDVTPLHALCKTVCVCFLYEETRWPGRMGRKECEECEECEGVECSYFMLGLFHVVWGAYKACVYLWKLKWSTSVKPSHCKNQHQLINGSFQSSLCYMCEVFLCILSLSLIFTCASTFSR